MCASSLQPFFYSFLSIFLREPLLEISELLQRHAPSSADLSAQFVPLPALARSAAPHRGCASAEFLAERFANALPAASLPDAPETLGAARVRNRVGDYVRAVEGGSVELQLTIAYLAALTGSVTNLHLTGINVLDKNLVPVPGVRVLDLTVS